MRTCSSGSILSEGRAGTHAEFPSRDGPCFFASQCPDDRLVRASQTGSKQLPGHALDHFAVLETMRESWQLMCASGKSIEPCRTCFKRGLMRVVNASILRITNDIRPPSSPFVLPGLLNQPRFLQIDVVRRLGLIFDLCNRSSSHRKVCRSMTCRRAVLECSCSK